MNPDAGLYYDICGRLRGHLARHRFGQGKPFTQSQQEAWDLLNQVEAMVKLLEKLARSLDPDDNTETAYQLRHTLLMHQPKWKSQRREDVYPGGIPSPEGHRERAGEEGPGQDSPTP
jgi:hypothetical protein